MLLNNSGASTDDVLFNERHNLPSRQLISTLSSITNGFLFSTTPIVIRILETICSDIDDSARSFISSGWLYGSIVGILLFGYIGDLLGYYRGMVFASSLSAIGLIFGSMSLSLKPNSLPFFYGFSRIITGIGTGGSIPIAYTRTVKSTQRTEMTRSSAFLLLLQSTSWLLGPTVLFFILRQLDSSPSSLLRMLQCVLVIAAIPSVISMFVLLRSSQTILYHPLHPEEVEDVESAAVPPKRPSLLRSFLATGVCWFLYDLNSYGNTLFSHTITRALYDIPDTPLGAAIPLIIIGIHGVSGQFVATGLLKRISVQRLQAMGFLVLTALFLLASWGFRLLESMSRSGKIALFIIYHLTFFFSLCGPGSTTFILPSLVFPEKDLSLYHGICTCLGKFGGALGASFFPWLVRILGIPKTLLFCGIITFAGFLCSLVI